MNLQEKLIQKINLKTKPLGSLGILEDLALKIGLIQNTLTPELKNPSMIVFAGDHGITDEKVSPFPKEVTFQMVMNFLQGGAAINVFCKQNHICLKVVDAGVDFDFEPTLNLIQRKIARGTRNFIIEKAMTEKECSDALEEGRKIAQDEFNTNCNIIAFGEMGIGNTSSAAMLMHKFTKLPVEVCVGKGTGLDDKGVQHKIEVLNRASEKHNVQIPFDVLQSYGGFEIAMMVGAMLQAAELGMIILVDGFIATSAVITAFHFNADVLKNCIFTHLSDERGHKLCLEYLKVEPVLQLRMRLGEGSGAAVAFPIVQAAVSFLNEMSSFEDAGVSNKD